MKSMAWWWTPVISSLGRLEQEANEFEANSGYIARSCLKSTKTKQKKPEEWWWLYNMVNILKNHCVVRFKKVSFIVYEL
jgi:hypothetical protein